jgi:hypothetical protein
MATVVIIHAAEDTLPARALAEKLRQAQLQVVLEKPPGDDLRAAVKGAPVAIALWSPRSTVNAEIAAEVSFARNKSKLVHALMQSAQAPEQFRGDKAVNLTGWRGEDDFAPWRELAALVTERAGVGPLPPPAPRPPSGFFQPGRPAEAPAQRAAPQAAPQVQRRPAPQRTAAASPPLRPAPAPPAPEREAKSGGKGLLIGALALILIGAAAAGGWYLMRQQGVQSADVWEQIDSGDPDALRAFLAGTPGSFRDEAEKALSELEERSFEAASDADTIEAFEEFLADFPDSEHAMSARGRIAELRTITAPAPDAVAPESAPTEPSPEDLLPPATAAPDPAAGPATIAPPAEPPPAPDPAPSDGAPLN